LHAEGTHYGISVNELIAHTCMGLSTSLTDHWHNKLNNRMTDKIGLFGISPFKSLGTCWPWQVDILLLDYSVYRLAHHRCVLFAHWQWPFMSSKYCTL